jgi:hypothetical protein
MAGSKTNIKFLLARILFQPQRLFVNNSVFVSDLQSSGFNNAPNAIMLLILIEQRPKVSEIYASFYSLQHIAAVAIL